VRAFLRKRSRFWKGCDQEGAMRGKGVGLDGEKIKKVAIDSLNHGDLIQRRHHKWQETTKQHFKLYHNRRFRFLGFGLPGFDRAKLSRPPDELPVLDVG
jgi:hypothetical protein